MPFTPTSVLIAAIKASHPQCAYIISIGALPDAPKHTATNLLLATKAWARRRAIPTIAYGARAISYCKMQGQISFDEYFKKVVEGVILDPLIRGAGHAGGQPISPIKNYFHDPESCDYGILVVHDTKEKYEP